MFEKTPHHKQILKKLKEAEKASKYLVMISYQDEELRLQHTYWVNNLAKEDVLKSVEEQKKLLQNNHK